MSFFFGSRAAILATCEIPCKRYKHSDKLMLLCECEFCVPNDSTSYLSIRMRMEYYMCVQYIYLFDSGEPSAYEQQSQKRNQYQLILRMVSHQTNVSRMPNQNAWRQIYIYLLWMRNMWMRTHSVCEKRKRADEKRIERDRKNTHRFLQCLSIDPEKSWGAGRGEFFRDTFCLTPNPIMYRICIRMRLHSHTCVHGVWCNCWSNQRYRFNRPYCGIAFRLFSLHVLQANATTTTFPVPSDLSLSIS